MPATSPCVPCCGSTSQSVQIPGPEGNDGVDGVNGIDSFTTTTANFSVPSIGSQVGVAVVQSAWMVPGQYVIVTGPATFIVVSNPTTTSCTLQFVGAPGDVVPLTNIGAGATVSPAGVPGGGWTTLSCKADQAIITSTALTNSTWMQFTMQPSTNYRLRAQIFFDTTAAGGFKFGMIGPAAAVLVRAQFITAIAGAAADFISTVDTSLRGSTNVGTGGGTSGTTGGYVAFDMIFQNGVNAGLFAFQFAQQASSTDTGAIVRAGSYMEFSIA